RGVAIAGESPADRVLGPSLPHLRRLPPRILPVRPPRAGPRLLAALTFGGGPFSFLLVGRCPAGVEGVARMVEVDEERGVVRGDGLALAGVAVDLDEDRSFRDGLRDEQMVDAHSEVLVEVAGAIVPPGVLPGVGVLLAEDVDQAPRAELGEGAPLRL